MSDLTYAEVLNKSMWSLSEMTRNVSVILSDRGVSVQVVPTGLTDRERIARWRQVCHDLSRPDWTFRLQRYNPETATANTGDIAASCQINGIPWNVWIALEDVTDIRGCLDHLPIRTHGLLDAIRDAENAEPEIERLRRLG